MVLTQNERNLEKMKEIETIITEKPSHEIRFHFSCGCIAMKSVRNQEQAC